MTKPVRKPRERFLHLRKMRDQPQYGAGVLYCILSFNGDEMDRIAFVRPDACPAFENESAWVRVDWWSTSRFRVVEVVADKRGTPVTPAA